MSEGRWADWIGREEALTDRLDEKPARAMAATLDRDHGHGPDGGVDTAPGAELPFVWLWLYFLATVPGRRIALDGHPERGGFLPPVELPRRMWAGSRCVFHDPARIGETVEKRSRILKVSEKSGKTGDMVFVTVGHETRAEGRLVMEEEQDIVYLAMPSKFSLPPAQPLPACDWSEPRAVDPVLLFRFSALTFNAHRIHYDRAYAMDVEKYPGLIVHGPLQAIMLYDAARRHAPGRRPARFDFRGVRPLFDFDEVSLNGAAREDGGTDLYVATADGATTMQAKMVWAD